MSDAGGHGGLAVGFGPPPGSQRSAALVCHQSKPCDAVDAVVVDVSLESGTLLHLRYRISGDILALRVPHRQAALRWDRLWEHTCCELFVATGGGADYCEWNFSPSGQVARFEFLGYRRRLASTRDTRLHVGVLSSATELALEVRVPLTLRVDDTLAISLAAVIESDAAGLSYWALCHPCDRPDFHDRRGFALALTAPAVAAAVHNPTESR